MPVFALEARDLFSPLFLVRTWAVISSCTAFSLVASERDPKASSPDSGVFWTLCVVTWSFFFALTFLIHTLSIVPFHSLIPVSWKNLTMTVAVLGALMTLSASIIFPWMVMSQETLTVRYKAATVASCFTTLAYISESIVISYQSREQRVYMATVPGALKILQLWGSCQTIALVVRVAIQQSTSVHQWQPLVLGMSYGVCVLMSLVTLIVILGDLAGRCFLPFDRFLTGFILSGVLIYMVTTVICFTRILQLRDPYSQQRTKNMQLAILETVLCSVTLLGYTVDLAFSIKQLFDRNHV